ncbi:MAG: diacylglycerol kinase family lipid kinase [Anaerolineales bacterium]|jgi:YegS/Rv2252/BmrU family lipid kinase
MRYLVIVNPISGRGYAEKVIPEIDAGMREHGLEFDLVRTERPWHAAEIAESAVQEGYDVIVTASGDGTANEAINGMMHARAAGFNDTAFSILPVGTGNDMAYGLGMRGTLQESIAALDTNYRKKIDIGFVKGGDYPEGRYFANGVGIGFDAAVGFVAVKIRWARGLLAYLVAVLQTIFIYYKSPTVEIAYNDIVHAQPALMVSIMNGQRMGGGFYMAPQGNPGDGHFDLCIASEASRARIFGLIPYFLKGTQAGQSEITNGQTDRISIKAVKGTLPAHCDGETLCESGQELSAEIIPAAIEIITLKNPA